LEVPNRPQRRADPIDDFSRYCGRSAEYLRCNPLREEYDVRREGETFMKFNRLVAEPLSGMHSAAAGAGAVADAPGMRFRPKGR